MHLPKFAHVWEAGLRLGVSHARMLLYLDCRPKSNYLKGQVGNTGPKLKNVAFHDRYTAQNPRAASSAPQAVNQKQLLDLFAKIGCGDKEVTMATTGIESLIPTKHTNLAL